MDKNEAIASGKYKEAAEEGKIWHRQMHGEAVINNGIYKEIKSKFWLVNRALIMPGDSAEYLLSCQLLHK